MDETDENISTQPPVVVEQAALKQKSLLGRFTFTWEGIVWLILAGAAVATRFWALGARVMSHDESLHVYYSWILSKGGGYVHNPMMHGPLLFELTALFDRIFGANDFTSRIVPALFGIAIVVGIPLLLRRWLGRWGALAASLIFLVSPYILFYSRYNRHDIEEITWVMLGLFAIFSYLHDREDSEANGHPTRWLLLLAGVEALMFSSMETAFFYLAIFASFLLIKMLAENGLHWKSIRESAEFDLLVVLATLGAFFSSPIALLVLNPVWTKITGQAFVPVAQFSTYGIEWAKGTYGVRIWGLMMVFWIAAAVIGMWWNAREWPKLSGVFLALTIAFFTTFLTNTAGIGTGFVGSLGYWLSQQSVARGNQPWYYYLIVFPLYEYLPLLGGIAAGVYFFVRQRFYSGTQKAFVVFLIWWAALIFLGLSGAGEKMPWLSTHITTPFILLTAWLVGDLLRRSLASPAGEEAIPDRLSRPALWAALAPVIALYILTVRTSYMVNYVNYDYTTEFVGYAHGAPGIRWTVEDINKIASKTGLGNSLQVAYDSEVSWPLTWYLRDHPGFFGDTPSRGVVNNAPVIIAGSQNWEKVESFLGADYNRYEVIRMWWPMEDYKGLTWERIWGAISNPEMRQAVWDIIWARDYHLYARLTGEQLDPPANWPLQDRMRIYIRKDIAAQVSGLALQSSQIADLQPKVDIYASKRIEQTPIRTLTTGTLNMPRNFALAADGSVFIADSGNAQIVHISANGKLIQTWGSRTSEGQSPPAPGTFNEPWGIAVDSQGNVYVADTWNHRIQKFDANGKFLLQWGTGGVSTEGNDRFWGPRGILVTPDGNVYITDTGNRRVVVFDSQGKYLFTFETNGDAQLDEPVGIALGQDQHIYVADTWNDRVAIFDLKGKFLSSFAVETWDSTSVDDKPFIAVDSSGQVYITDPENARVIVFSRTGEPLAVFGQTATSGGLNLPTGIQISAQGEVYIADAGNNRIVVYPTYQP